MTRLLVAFGVLVSLSGASCLTTRRRPTPQYAVVESRPMATDFLATPYDPSALYVCGTADAADAGARWSCVDYVLFETTRRAGTGQ